MAHQLSDPVNQQEYRDILCLSTHKMTSKLQAFTKFSSKIPHHYDWNNWDQKFDELVTNAENICSHFKSFCLEYHPTIVPWIRQTIVSWLLWLHDGKITNIGNLIWAVIKPCWKCLCCVMLADSPQITFWQSTCWHFGKITGVMGQYIVKFCWLDLIWHDMLCWQDISLYVAWFFWEWRKIAKLLRKSCYNG